MAKMCVILTTTADKKSAKKLSAILLRKNLAACVQMVRIKSRFVWRGRVTREREYLLIIKTLCKNHKKIKRVFNSHHPYKLPEFVHFKANASKAYKKWMKGVVG